MDKNRDGYTLFELLVVISIIILFTGVSMAYYNSFNELKRLEAETKKFVEILELAKKKTISGDKACAGYTGSYRVSWTVSPSTYVLTPMGCSDQLSYSLPVGFVFLGAINSVTFEPFGLGTSSNCIIIKNNTSGKCRKVSVESSATINETVDGACSCP